MIFHLIGIGGIGMSALAKILLQQGHQVQGSDIVESSVLENLRSLGASIRIGHASNDMDGTTVVYSSAISEQNEELVYAKIQNLPKLHRSELLDMLMKEKLPLLVTGTHGKTTTTALLFEVLLEAKEDPSFVVGGILQSIETNGRQGKGQYFVVEADESDGSFLKTSSFGAIVTNCDNDHLDYWHSEENLNNGFKQFFSQVKNWEHLFWCRDDERLSSFNPPGYSYGFSEKSDLCLSSYRPAAHGIVFDLYFQGRWYRDIELALSGRHNALNGAAVFGLSLSLGVAEAVIRKAFSSFKGTKRRLEFKGHVRGVDVFDDYGHHPTEIVATLKALRDQVGQRRLVVVFQPHRFSRARDQLDVFPNCFNDADEVILTDIYSSGEIPIVGISDAILRAKMEEKLAKKLVFFPRVCLEEEVAKILRPHDVLLTIGAGDVTKASVLILRKYEQL